MEKKETRALAKNIWGYLRLGHEVGKVDCIVVLGSYDLDVAKRGGELFLLGIAPRIVFSGGFGRITSKIWSKPEAHVFSEVAIKMGVPKEKIIIEDKSSNTRENILFTKQSLEKIGSDIHKILLVCKPYSERRAFVTCKKLWPEVECLVTSQEVSFEEYLDNNRGQSDVIDMMVGDVQRIKLLPEKGLQIKQDIPDDVWDAYVALMDAGYDKALYV